MVAPARAPLRTDRLRAVNEPQPVTVEVDASGAPAAVKKQLRRSDGQEATAAVVETILEMWRIDDEWWRQLISRRYFAVILEGGARVVLFEDLVTGEWFMQTP
jgi:cell wall assembly regulator SMI1